MWPASLAGDGWRGRIAKEVVVIHFIERMATEVQVSRQHNPSMTILDEGLRRRVEAIVRSLLGR